MSILSGHQTLSSAVLATQTEGQEWISVNLETFGKIGRHQYQISDGDHVQHVGTDSYSSLTGKWSNIAQFLVSTEVLGERIFLVL